MEHENGTVVILPLRFINRGAPISSFSLPSLRLSRVHREKEKKKTVRLIQIQKQRVKEYM